MTAPHTVEAAVLPPAMPRRALMGPATDAAARAPLTVFDAPPIDFAALLGSLPAAVPATSPTAPRYTAKDLAQHRDALLRFARRKVRDEALAEDAVQDTMLAAIGALPRFEGQSALRTWLIGILNHKIQDVFRRETRFVPLASDDDESGDGWSGEPVTTVDPSAEVAGQRMHQALGEAVDALPPTLREVFRMQAIEGLDTRQVCDTLGITEANCWVRLHRARKRVAAALAPHMSH